MLDTSVLGKLVTCSYTRKIHLQICCVDSNYFFIQPFNFFSSLLFCFEKLKKIVWLCVCLFFQLKKFGIGLVTSGAIELGVGLRRLGFRPCGFLGMPWRLGVRPWASNVKLWAQS